MRFAGIGSRETPSNVLKTMYEIAVYLGERGWILRSGCALGADSAFEAGAINVKGDMELFLAAHARGEEGWERIAAQYHPAWHRCNHYARLLHARNAAIILGPNLDLPVDFVVCWTKDGGPTGGTGLGIRIAEAYNIPVFNLKGDETGIALGNYLQETYL